MGIGDWGLGPIPNPQSPIPIVSYYFEINFNKKIFKNDIYNKFKFYSLK
jgi:hypothetical protein